MAALALTVSACGSRLTGNQAALAQGAFGHSGSGSGTRGTAPAPRRSAPTLDRLRSGSTSATSTDHDRRPPRRPRDEGDDGEAVLGVQHDDDDDRPVLVVELARPGQRPDRRRRVHAAHTGAASTGAAAANQACASAGGAGAGACGANGNQAPAGGNGGATATGVTASTITVGNIASISGVAPGLTQSAQQATEAWAAYVNSTGGICGRQIKVQPFDDGNDSSTNYADASQACSSDFAMVGNASGFDDGSAQAVGSCGIPDMAAEVSTTAAGTTADIFGASPGNAHYWALGPANYLKSLYPNAVQKAAMIYLQVSATESQAAHEVAAYQSVGWHYVYNAARPRPRPTTAPSSRHAEAGAQYVTEYSDDNSAERLLQAMQQANYSPQVVDWFSEEYTPSFAQQTSPESNGDLVAHVGDGGLRRRQLQLGHAAHGELAQPRRRLRQLAPGHLRHLGLVGRSRLRAGGQGGGPGPDEERAHHPAPGHHQLDRGWRDAAGEHRRKIPSKCFFYEKIQNGGFQRVYPTAPNTYDCNSGYFQY